VDETGEKIGKNSRRKRDVRRKERESERLKNIDKYKN
jgi:hypothetical protein